MKTTFLRVAVLATFSCALNAQVAAVRAGSFEIGGFIGSSYGLDHYQVMGGGNVSYGVTKYILPYVEYSYFPGIERQQKGLIQVTGGNPIPYVASQAIPFSDFHGGIHLRVPIRESHLVPYGVFGVGGLTSFARDARYVTADGRTGTVPFPGETNVAINFGGGFRYYIGPRYGIRLEAKAYKPYGGPSGFNDFFGKVEFGFFFQLH